MGNQPPSMLPSQSELERLFDLSLDLFCIAGFDGYFRRVNLAFERTLGYSKEWLLSRPMLDTVHPDDLQSCYDALGDLANGNDLIGFENRVVCADGSVRWLQWNTRAVPEERFVYGVARDVTDRRRADAELRQAHQMVEASHDELRVLAEEQAALRRVATLVAQGGPSDRLLEVVAEEVGRVVHVPLVSIVRYETDNAATEVGNFSERGRLFPVGARWSLDGQSVVARVRERGRPARIDDHSGLEGEIAELVQRLGSVRPSEFRSASVDTSGVRWWFRRRSPSRCPRARRRASSASRSWWRRPSRTPSHERRKNGSLTSRRRCVG
jgi:PAS domain S-box-containing protein